MSITPVTDATFVSEVLGSELPVVVDIWAAWCGPCKAIAPILEHLDAEYAGRVKIVKIDADAKGGAALSIAHSIKKPIAFLSTGQGYDDIIKFDSQWMVDRLFNEKRE